MSSLIGKEKASLQDLRKVPFPLPTKTYVPVHHEEVANMAKSIACNVLHNFSFVKEQFVLNREGRQMFGVLTFRSNNTLLDFSIGIRNSYDKSLSLGLCLGASVMVCENLMFSGEIVTFRKHTINIMQDIGKMFLTAIYEQKENYDKIQKDADWLKTISLKDDDAYRIIGLLYGRGALSPRQLPVVKNEWENPAYDEFKPRTAFSLYNAVTESLKTTPASSIMEKHIQVHQIFTGGVA